MLTGVLSGCLRYNNVTTFVTTTYSRTEQRGWYFYDFANSPFSSTVITLFLGPYLTSIAKAAAAPDGYLHPLGLALDPRALWGFLVSLSVLTQVFFLPWIGAMADHSSRKKVMLAGLAYIGALATMLMFTLKAPDWVWGSALFLVANLAFGASIVVYNSYLPEIAAPEERDNVSATGWGLGYLGGGLLLAANLVLYSSAAKYGLTDGEAVRWSLLSAGVWWAFFTLIPLKTLRNRPSRLAPIPFRHHFTEGFQSFFQTLKEIASRPQTLLFLVAYLLYNDAIQAVIALAAQFGSDELKIGMKSLTTVILMVQFVAFAGAFVFNFISRAIGAKRAVLLALVIWIAILVAMYSVVRTEGQFFIAAAAVAVVMGGSQALSRSLFSMMIPKGREAEYFGLYEISDKGTSWLAPLLFSLSLQYTGNYRLSILSLVVFFVAGLVLLWRVNVQRAAEEAAAA